MPDVQTKKRGSRPPGKESPSNLQSKPIQPPREYFFGRVLGISLSPSGLSLAAAMHLGPKRTVTAVKQIRWTEGTDDDARRRLFAEAVEAFVAEHGRPRRIVAAMSGAHTAFRSLVLPELKKHDLEAAIRIEAAKQIPFPSDDAYIGFLPIRRLSTEDRSRYKISVHAATRGSVEQVIEPLGDYVPLLSGAHSSHALIGELLRQLPDFDPNRSFTVLRLGWESTEIAFYHGSTPEVCHVTSTGVSMLGDNPDVNRLEFFTETLATEIQTSFDYYAGHSSAPSNPTIYVHGVSAESDVLLSHLENRLGYHFRSFPTAGLGKTLGKTSATEAVLNLPAMAAALNHTGLPNLLPPDMPAKIRQRKADRLGRLAVAALMVLMMTGWLLLNRDVQVMQDQAARIETQLELYRSSPAYQTYMLMQSNLVQTSRYLRAARKDPSYLWLNLKELSNQTPAEIRLIRYDLDAGVAADNLLIQGVVSSKQIPPEVILAEFVERLRASPFYESVTLERHVKRRIDDGFELSFRLRMDGVL